MEELTARGERSESNNNAVKHQAPSTIKRIFRFSVTNLFESRIQKPMTLHCTLQVPFLFLVSHVLLSGSSTYSFTSAKSNFTIYLVILQNNYRSKYLLA